MNNLEFVTDFKNQNDLSFRELADASEYSEEAVRAWFSDPSSSKYRPVPDRAVSILKLKKQVRKI